VRILLLSLICLLCIVQPASAQEGCQIEEDFEYPTVELADGTEIQVIVYPNVFYSHVQFLYDGYYVRFDFNDSSLTPGISEEMSRFYSSPSGVAIQGNGPAESTVDTSYLPPEHMALWSKLLEMCNILKDSPDFWTLIESETDYEDFIDREAFIDVLRNGITDLAEGLYTPDAASLEFSIKFAAGHINWLDLPFARQYILTSDYGISLATPDEYLSDEPEIFLFIIGNGYQDNWEVHIDPEVQTCVIWALPDDPYYEGVDDYVMIDEVLASLELFREYIPILSEDDLVPYPEDLLILINQAMVGLTEYEISFTESDY